MADDPRDEHSAEDLADLLAAEAAERDQALASLPEAAAFARSLFDAYEEQGFSSQQALYLTAVQITHPPLDTP